MSTEPENAGNDEQVAANPPADQHSGVSSNFQAAVIKIIQRLRDPMRVEPAWGDERDEAADALERLLGLASVWPTRKESITMTEEWYNYVHQTGDEKKRLVAKVRKDITAMEAQQILADLEWARTKKLAAERFHEGFAAGVNAAHYECEQSRQRKAYDDADIDPDALAFEYIAALPVKTEWSIEEIEDAYRAGLSRITSAPQSFV